MRSIRSVGSGESVGDVGDVARGEESLLFASAQALGSLVGSLVGCVSGSVTHHQ
ncbi:MAG: hypothetical protein WBA93_35820 [Microcoleaceae cyanobacterium]